jgi:hypothetical protein
VYLLLIIPSVKKTWRLKIRRRADSRGNTLAG